MAFLLSAGLECAQPLSLMLTYNYSPPGRSGEALGLRLMVNNIAHVAFPFGFGFLASAFGIMIVFWANAGILAGGALLTQRGRQVTPVEEEMAPPAHDGLVAVPLSNPHQAGTSGLRL